MTLQRDEYCLCWPQHPHGRTEGIWNNVSRLHSRNAERSHYESIYLIRILQRRTTNIAISYKSTYASQRDIKT